MSQANEQWVTTMIGNIFQDKPINVVRIFIFSRLVPRLIIYVTYSLLPKTPKTLSRSFKRWCLSLDVWRVSDFAVFDLRINTQLLS